MFVKFSEFAPQPCFVSSPCTPCFVSSPPHALKGQKLLAQGSALGINSSQQGAL